MTITHHPSDLALVDFAAGILDEAQALVISAHLLRCPQCRNAVRSFESIGGALLDGAEPAEMTAGALDRALENLDTRQPAPAAAVSEGNSLLGYPLGQWRWLGRGIQWRSVDVPSTHDVRMFMLKAEPGTKLPRHRHTGTEWTCVFQGAFRHQLGRYGAGDFDEADDTVEHDPSVEEGEACICLVALHGSIQLQGLVGRLLQPLLRM